MATRTTVHCDQCGKQVDYIDSDADSYVFGYKLVDKAQFEFSNHSPNNCGYSGKPSKSIVAPENICSKECMVAYFQDWLHSLPEIEVTRRGLVDRVGDKSHG